MFKFIILFLFVQQVFSIDEQVISISENPLLPKVFGLLDQLLVQVRKMQTLIIHTYDMINKTPNDLRPVFAECFTATDNTTRIQYSVNLNEAELTRIPQIQDQLKQATTLDQQFNTMNMTYRIVSDISLNVIKPGLSFVNGILDCFRSKS